MSREDEAHRQWGVRPCENPVDWWTVGYTYEGSQGQHQGEFVPTYHWSGKAEADAYCAALLAGFSREQARQAALEV